MASSDVIEVGAGEPGDERGPVLVERRPRLMSSRTFRRLRRDRAVVISLTFLLLLIVVALFADTLTPQDPNALNLTRILEGPSGDHWLGTDGNGRDILSRLIVATGITLTAMAQGLGIAILLGVPIGLLAGFAGRSIDSILSRLADGVLALPPLLLAMAIVGFLGAGLTNAMVAVGIVVAPRLFRLARSAAQSTAHETYIEACRAGGVPTTRILWRHVLPNSMGPLLVQVTFGAGLVISAEASLSFLGLGVQTPQASWGSMIREAFTNIRTSSWPIIPPSAAVVLTIAMCFALGDGLQTAVGRNAGGNK